MTSYPTWDQLTAELHVALLNGSADRHDLTCYVSAVREAGSESAPADYYGPEAFYWPAWADIDGSTEPAGPEPSSLSSIVESERAVVRERILASRAEGDEDGYDIDIAEDVEYLNGKLVALDWVLTQLNAQKEPSHA